jgi:hypothetical protein
MARSKQLARRPDERPAAQVLLVAGLLADHHEVRTDRPFAEDRLRRVLADRTFAATVGARA